MEKSASYYIEQAWRKQNANRFQHGNAGDGMGEQVAAGLKKILSAIRVQKSLLYLND